MDFAEGEILSFDKPYGWTSFDVVGKVRWMICNKLGVKKLKVGHTGTLDPLATGVVVVCTGRNTKKIDELQAQEKDYLATLQLGATTPSFDMEHPIDKTYATGHITEELITSVIKQFEGEIQQIPPVYSAVKVNGKRAYAYARKGEEPEIKSKSVTINRIDMLSFNPESMQLELRIECSKGTYIRSLARDMGQALGTGAYLTALRRTRSGDYRVEDSLTIEQFEGLLNSCIVPQKQEAFAKTKY